MEVLDRISEKGPIRSKNEDATIYLNHPKNKNFKLLAVADGMGGKEYGELASNYTINEITKWFNHKTLEDLNDNDKVIKLVNRLIKKINNKLITHFGENVTGTTLTLAIKNKKNTIIFNIGDSRAYIYKDKELLQITEDDSDVWMYYKYGNVSKEDLRYFAMSNLINACLGINKNLCHVSTSIISNNYEILLLLTDGVTDLLTDKKITKIIKKVPSAQILATIINEALNVNQNLFVPLKLKRKYLAQFVVPVMGRDNASGVIYIKN